MQFSSPLQPGRLIRRYKRFLADVETPGGILTAHCPNTGSMMGCAEPGMGVWLSPAMSPARKLAWTWELVEALPGVLVGLHTGRSNALIESGRLEALAGYRRIRREVKYGTGSRVDLLLEADDRPPCYLEVKNVTAAVADGLGYFPDAVTARGTKHLRELAGMVAAGYRAMLVFCVQRKDVREVRPADHIDPVYGRTLREAMAAGVEVVALGAAVAPTGIELRQLLPVRLP